MRVPKLGPKKIGKYQYWSTKANGGAYFGRVDLVTRQEALAKFYMHLAENKPEPEVVQEPIEAEGSLTLARVIQEFIDGLRMQKLDPKSIERKKTEVNFFASYRYQGRLLAQMDPWEIDAAILRDYLDTTRKPKLKKGAAKIDPNQAIWRGLSDQSVLHAETAIRHMFRYAEKFIKEMKGHYPFNGVKRTIVIAEPKTESCLLAKAEIKGIVEASGLDVHQFKGQGAEYIIKKFGAGKLKKAKDDFSALIRTYLGTGARTGEFYNLKVSAVNRITKTIAVRDHKNAAKGKTRIIHLNPETNRIIQKQCERKGPDDFLFLKENGKPWNKESVHDRFRTVKGIANALGYDVRPEITIYYFRDYWISKAVMSGVPIASVARMAGNSVAVIEKNYLAFASGHFQSELAKVDLSF